MLVFAVSPVYRNLRFYTIPLLYRYAVLFFSVSVFCASLSYLSLVIG